MDHYFEAVPLLGNVAVSRHAQSQMKKENISQEEFELVLLHPIRKDVPDGMDVIWRERGGIRLVIQLNPKPFRGAKLVVTVYRVKIQEKVR